jgi:hypothetical protein
MFLRVLLCFVFLSQSLTLLVKTSADDLYSDSEDPELIEIDNNFDYTTADGSFATGNTTWNVTCPQRGFFYYILLTYPDRSDCQKFYVCQFGKRRLQRFHY